MSIHSPIPDNYVVPPEHEEDNMVRRTIWLARHGNREDFVDPRWRETAPYPHDPDLSPDGIEQAKRLALRLAGQSIDAIYTSPFLRAMHTAHYSALALGVPIIVDSGLSECLSDYHGVNMPLRPANETRPRFPSIQSAAPNAIVPRYPEEWPGHLERCRRAIRAILSNAPPSILCVSHGTPCTAIVCALTGLTETDLSGVPGGYCAMELCALTRLDRTGGRWALTLCNDKRHLDSDDWVHVPLDSTLSAADPSIYV